MDRDDEFWFDSQPRTSAGDREKAEIENLRRASFGGQASSLSH
jgi:hypothetical protein